MVKLQFRESKIYIRLFSNSTMSIGVGADYLAVLDKLIWSVDALPEKEKIKSIALICANLSLGQSLAKHFPLISII